MMKDKFSPKLGFSLTVSAFESGNTGVMNNKQKTMQ